MAVHWPWFQATITSPDSDGAAMEPSGAATGLYGHGSLWVATGIAVAQLVLLLARHVPGGRPRVPGDGALLAVGSILVCLIVTADLLALPHPWVVILSDGGGVFPVPFPWWRSEPGLVLTLGFGAVVAAAAAVASLAAAFASPGPVMTRPASELAPGLLRSPQPGLR